MTFHRLKILLFQGFILFNLSAGCVHAQVPNPIDVAVTIVPLKDFVEAIGQDKVQVLVMIPPSANPHTYEPSPQQLKKLD